MKTSNKATIGLKKNKPMAGVKKNSAFQIGYCQEVPGGYTVTVTDYKGKPTLGIYDTKDFENRGSEAFPKFACQVNKAKTVLANVEILTAFVEANGGWKV